MSDYVPRFNVPDYVRATGEIVGEDSPSSNGIHKPEKAQSDFARRARLAREVPGWKDLPAAVKRRKLEADRLRDNLLRGQP